MANIKFYKLVKLENAKKRKKFYTQINFQVKHI